MLLGLLNSLIEKEICQTEFWTQKQRVMSAYLTLNCLKLISHKNTPKRTTQILTFSGSSHVRPHTPTGLWQWESCDWDRKSRDLLKQQTQGSLSWYGQWYGSSSTVYGAHSTPTFRTVTSPGKTTWSTFNSNTTLMHFCLSLYNR